jgi:hypothetical protein
MLPVLDQYYRHSQLIPRLMTSPWIHPAQRKSHRGEGEKATYARHLIPFFPRDQ